MRSVSVDGDFTVRLAYYVNESRDGISVTINIIETLRTEMCFVILMFEELSFHHQPTIRVGVKFPIIADMWSVDFEVEILKFASFGRGNCFYLPLVRLPFADGDEGLHLLSGPNDDIFGQVI